jgi:hypothetical protein
MASLSRTIDLKNYYLEPGPHPNMQMQWVEATILQATATKMNRKLTRTAPPPHHHQQATRRRTVGEDDTNSAPLRDPT